MKINPHKLDLALAKACLSAKDLQKEACVSDVTLARIRNGAQQPRPATVGRIARALGVNVEELIEQEVR